MMSKYIGETEKNLKYIFNGASAGMRFCFLMKLTYFLVSVLR